MPRRTLVVLLEQEIEDLLRAKAKERKISVTQLAGALLKKIVEDDLFTAVLDD
jgi:hypothetical protein